ncbi:hypothetical protein D3C85_1643930 [compost metagenome]
MAHDGIAVFVLAFDGRAWVVHVGEHHARAAEHVVFQRHVVIDGDVVLDLDAVADLDAIADVDVLTQGTGFADNGAARYVDPVPDAGAGAKLRAVVDDGGGMDAHDA